MYKHEIEPWDYDKRLSRSFTVGDLVCDKTAYDYEVLEQYIKRPAIENNLLFFCTTFLQPLQDAFPYQIKIISGYRCSRLNHLRGGGSSLHLIGFAADIVAYGHLPYLTETILQMEFHQLKIYPGFVHVSRRDTLNSCQVIKYR